MLPSAEGHTLVHFIFGLADDLDARRFGYSHFLAVRAASIHMQPATIWFHCHYLPQGEWWVRAKPLLQRRHVEVPRHIFGRPLRHPAHRADVLRLQLLIAHGGVYLDLDVIVLRPFAPLATHDFTIGREGHPDHGGFHGLCNAVLIARPNATFARRWLAEYANFGDPRQGDPWSFHSVQLPVQLALAHPSEVRLLPHTAFFWPDWDEPMLKRLMLEHFEMHAASQPRRTAGRRGARSGRVSEGAGTGVGVGRELHVAHTSHATAQTRYALHLWSSLSTPYILSQWSSEYLHTIPSTLNCLLSDTIAPPPEDGLRRLRRRECSCAAFSTAISAHTLGAEAAEGPPAPLAMWPLRPSAAPQSSHLLEDTAGGCFHGWIYSQSLVVSSTAPGATAPYVLRKEGRSVLRASVGRKAADADDSSGAFDPWWAPAPSFLGGRCLSFESASEAFVPLPPQALDDFSLSWWAEVHTLLPRCGAGAVFWTLAFDDGTISTEVRPLGVGLSPLVASTRPSVRLPSRPWGARRSVLEAAAVSVCSNGWHHFLVSVSARRQEVSVFIDGVDVAQSAYLHSQEAHMVRGLWIGTSEPPISRRGPREARPGVAQQVSLSHVALFSPSVLGQQLPKEAIPPAIAAARGWEAWPAQSMHSPSGGLLPARWPWQEVSAQLEVQDLSCGACTGTLEAETTNFLTPLLGMPHRSDPRGALPRIWLSQLSVVLACTACVVVRCTRCRLHQLPDASLWGGRPKPRTPAAYQGRSSRYGHERCIRG